MLEIMLLSVTCGRCEYMLQQFQAQDQKTSPELAEFSVIIWLTFLQIGYKDQFESMLSLRGCMVGIPLKFRASPYPVT